MRKFLILFLVFALFLCTGCQSEESEPTWKDIFKVEYRHVEATDPNTWEIGEPFVIEHEYYTVANTTNDVYESVELVIEVRAFGGKKVYLQKYVGTLKQGESKEVKIWGFEYEECLEDNDLDKTSFSESYLVEITYKLKN